ncbi:DNA polymerase III subunit gamma and tau [Ornithinimicrobium cerasi]|uniref:DNA polymerase III subunit gamma and tau n=1 Tax=Ornithinimicrobium cerasi TaxID=2248773 RepID=UPI000EFE5305|nr:DNA polymerase III subunit gamma and tau [Ornithinimicrobium cerasi]
MSTALYRRYRPESFADVIGQEHVTEPLMQALRSGRVNHAYLFSGPRGCGKTTSARILARCLNCDQGPTPEPCGTCDSCVALARDGAGTVDVIEIDAASHGGVDDARDLRERAAFGPAQSRYKVYIIDEAHMVTPNGFNALLKVVEEPPPHVKFIFATTEPEKVLATIRSRTHHYPFHLVPPQRLTSYLEQVCEREEVALEPGVLSFVTRAGAGSVRDSLSVLDQLISGAHEDGLTYERTAALLGFTDVELLDAVVDAVAAGDAATVFQQVHKVMESGHDPRRFVEDLLERYRDLIVLSAVGDQPAGGLLPGLPADQIERMRHQAAVQGPETLSRAADVVSSGLSEMTGAISFRLVLELLVARLLLPGPSGEEGYGARLDRIERRLEAAAGGQGGPALAPSPGRADSGPSRPPEGPRAQPLQPRPDQPRAQHQPPAQEEPPQHAEPDEQHEQHERPEAAGPVPTAPGVLDTAAMRRQWPEILEAVKAISRQTWSGLQTAQLLDFDGRRILLGKPDRWWVDKFMGTRHEETLKLAISEYLGLTVGVEAVSTGGPDAGPPGAGLTGAGPPDEQVGPPAPGTPPFEEPQHVVERPQVGRLRTRPGAAAAATALSSDGRPADPPGVSREVVVVGSPGPTVAEQLGAAAGRRSTGAAGPDWSEQTRTTAAPGWATGPASAVPGPAGPAPASAPAAETSQDVRRGAGGDAPSVDDEDLASSGAVGQPVIETVLGGTVIAINDDPVA